MFIGMNTNTHNNSIRRGLRKIGKELRRSVPVVVAVLVLLGLVGTTLAGALAL